MSNFKNLDSANKPREKLLLKGCNNLSDSELLALILNSGTVNESVLKLSTSLLEKYSSVDNILKQSINELLTNKGIGKAKACKLQAVGELSKRCENSSSEINYIKNSSDVYELLNEYKDLKQEKFIVINLDSRGKVINYDVIYKGTIDEIVIHPREIFNYALKNMAKAIIICHNHPSGNPTPSDNDITATTKLVEISKITGITIIDHVIITRDDFYSMRENCDVIFK